MLSQYRSTETFVRLVLRKYMAKLIRITKANKHEIKSSRERSFVAQGSERALEVYTTLIGTRHSCNRSDNLGLYFRLVIINSQQTRSSDCLCTYPVNNICVIVDDIPYCVLPLF